MSHRERGASYVSLYWTIGFGLLTVAAIAVAFFQGSEVGKRVKEIDELEKSLTQETAKVQEVTDRYRAFSEKAGFTGDKPEGTADAAGKLIDTAKKDLGTDTPANAKTVEDLLNAALAVNARHKREVEERDAQIGNLKTEVTQQTAAVQTARQELQRQLDESQTRARDQQTTDTARISSLEQQLSDKDQAAKTAAEKVTAVTEQKDKEVLEWSKKYSLVEAKNADLNTKIAFTRQPPTPKGSIVAVSELLPVGYIDLGEKQRVKLGMRFEVLQYDSKHRLSSKGFVAITKVEPSMSEVRLEPSDKLLPINKGDLLLNPLYDPTAQRKAVLVGRYPLSTGGRKGVEEKLKDLGVTVVEKVDATVDYLIVGAPEYSNTGDVLDMESNPEVIAAAKYGTLRYTLKDLEGFLKK
jgi:hypothetical protein